MFHIYIDDRLDLLDLDRALAQLPAWRLRHVLALRHEQLRRQSAAAYLLLCRALSEQFGITAPPPFAYGPNGKPCLPDRPDVHFNLSHCAEAALCVVSDVPIGADVEAVSQYDVEVARYAMCTAELRAILGAPRPDLAFTRLWTAKEAVLKLSGRGLTGQHQLQAILAAEAPHVVTTTYDAPDLRYVYSVSRERTIMP